MIFRRNPNRLSLSLCRAGPYFDRCALVVARTFVTLAADGRDTICQFAPDEQASKCTGPGTADAYAPVPGGWGLHGLNNCDTRRAQRNGTRRGTADDVAACTAKIHESEDASASRQNSSRSRTPAPTRG